MKILSGGLLLLTASVPLVHYLSSQVGVNASEYALTPAKVQAGVFRKVASYTVDGHVFAQPLYVPSVPLAGKLYDLLIVASMHDTVYAFDANATGSAALWTVSVGTSRTSYPDSPTLYGAESGCLSTPVVDPAAKLLYVSCTVSTPNVKLAKIDLTSGSILSSVIVSASVPGTGDPGGSDCVSGGVLSFCPEWEIQRPGLTLANGIVYLGFGSYNDDHPWHGWLIGYRASDLSQAGAWCASPNGYGGAVWNAGMAPAVDGAGNVYAVTGNGDYDGTANFGESIVKLSPTLAVLDWFTPANWSTLNNNDQDLGSSGAMLIPGTALAAWGAKDGNVYSVNTGCMGHLGGTVGGCTAPQVFQAVSPTCTSDCGIYGGAVFFGGTGYFPNVAQHVYAFSLTGSTWSKSSVAQSVSYAFPGATMAISAGGTSNAIVWTVTVGASNETSLRPGTLRALSPSDLSEWWDSDTTGHDSLGTASKFSPPTVANGRVYVATQDLAVQVFGLRFSSQVRGETVLRGKVTLR